jgi:DNA-binding CsgD family transcriptional regulator
MGSDDKPPAQAFESQNEHLEAVRASLSESEKEVFDLMVDGFTLEEIGKTLNISAHSVRICFLCIRRKIRELRNGANLPSPNKNDSTEDRRARYPLRGTLVFYNDPTAPAGEDDWNALK